MLATKNNLAVEETLSVYIDIIFGVFYTHLVSDSKMKKTISLSELHRSAKRLARAEMLASDHFCFLQVPEE